MEVKEKVQLVIDTLDEIEEYSNGLNEQLSRVERKEQDLLHYVENNKVNVLWCYRYIKELRKIRIERREIKNNMELCQKFNENKSKLISNIDNRKFILAEVCKREKQLNMPYKNREYEDEELQNILKGV